MPISAIHTGEHLADELAELDMTAETLACSAVRVPVAHVADVLDMQAPITGDLARLAHFFRNEP